MKFGKVDDPSLINFDLPEDHPSTRDILEKYGSTSPTKVYVGSAKWNRKDLKNFYPRGTKDELSYYSNQFNAIEMNSTFYRIFPEDQIIKWRDKTPDNFRFFPKIYQGISHWKQLKDVRESVDQFLESVIHFEDKLGTIFLQLNERFRPNAFEKLEKFVVDWPTDLDLSIEVRHEDWFNNSDTSSRLFELLENHGIGNTLVDTPGRRDLMHMRLTNPRPFIRFVSTSPEYDRPRIDQWVNRISEWNEQGLEQVGFFVHQAMEEDSKLLASYLVEKLNDHLKLKLHVPETIH